MTPGTVRRLHGQGLSYGRLSQVLGLPKSTLAARGAEKRTSRLTKVYLGPTMQLCDSRSES